MATDIASKEPETFRAGDTVKWKRSLDCYKASEGWTHFTIWPYRFGWSK